MRECDIVYTNQKWMGWLNHLAYKRMLKFPVLEDHTISSEIYAKAYCCVPVLVVAFILWPSMHNSKNRLVTRCLVSSLYFGIRESIGRCSHHESLTRNYLACIMNAENRIACLHHESMEQKMAQTQVGVQT